jgi:hypothetical protein
VLAAVLVWYTMSEGLVYGGGSGVVVWLGWMIVGLPVSGRVVWRTVLDGTVIVAWVWAWVVLVVGRSEVAMVVCGYEWGMPILRGAVAGVLVMWSVWSVCWVGGCVGSVLVIESLHPGSSSGVITPVCSCDLPHCGPGWYGLLRCRSVRWPVLLST